ncbi:MAG TPA: F0F1 ATP synthase subunit B [Alphaproteobacteria bacterium]|nr:F0F1 ATP synthase subunit B [Alphaproteobacteria bacterium]
MFSLENPTLWVAVAAIAFIAVVWRPLGSMIAKGLDGRAARIRAEIDEAEKLLSDAKTLLARYTGQLATAEVEARQIIAQAEADAEAVRQRAAKELEYSLTARQQHVMDRIAQAEASAVAEVRSATVTATMDAARRGLKQHLNDNQQDALLQKAVSAVEKNLR